jgi:hypothetical protein
MSWTCRGVCHGLPAKVIELATAAPDINIANISFCPSFTLVHNAVWKTMPMHKRLLSNTPHNQNNEQYQSRITFLPFLSRALSSAVA